MMLEIFCDCCSTPHQPQCQTGYYDDESQRWIIQLNRYQRDNLLWLFTAIRGWYTDRWESIWPFNHLNTGDWAGEIPNMLGRVDQPTSKHGTLDPSDATQPYQTQLNKDHPNSTMQALREDVQGWMDQKIVERVRAMTNDEFQILIDLRQGKI